MSEPFKIYKANKMQDWIENHVTEWAYGLISEHFGVDSPEELSREQLDEVITEWEEMVDYDGTLAMGLRNAISTWENEHDDYII
jgi:hypothetical protein